jgi:mono/diheme cytochrome c family protein
MSRRPLAVPASTTIRNGRLDMGMPAWKDMLDDKQIGEVIGFLAPASLRENRRRRTGPVR